MAISSRRRVPLARLEFGVTAKPTSSVAARQQEVIRGGEIGPQEFASARREIGLVVGIRIAADDPRPRTVCNHLNQSHL